MVVPFFDFKKPPLDSTEFQPVPGKKAKTLNKTGN